MQLCKTIIIKYLFYNFAFRFLSRLSKQRRADAENKSVAPTLPLPLLNKPSSNIKEVKSSIENSKIMDSKTQDIAQKMFPGNNSNAVQTELSKGFLIIQNVIINIKNNYEIIFQEKMLKYLKKNLL